MHRPLVRFGIALLFCTVAAAQPTVRMAVVALTGRWKFHIGDDPRWADPNFDDSNWENVNLTPKGATDYMNGLSEHRPGWTARGYPGYSGCAWYRLKVRIEQTNAPLSLLMPLEVDDGYQVFANGREIGQFGDLTPRRPVLYFTNAEWFRLPATSGETKELAIRLYMDPWTLMQPFPSGMRGPPRIGATGVIAAFGNLARQRFVMLAAAWALLSIVCFGFAFAFFAIYWLDRSETVYLWFGFAYLGLAVSAVDIFPGVAVPNWPTESELIFHVLVACWVGGLFTA